MVNDAHEDDDDDDKYEDDRRMRMSMSILIGFRAGRAGHRSWRLLSVRGLCWSG